MVYSGYYKVMFNIPKMGQLPTPVEKRRREDQTKERVRRKKTQVREKVESRGSLRFSNDLCPRRVGK